MTFYLNSTAADMGTEHNVREAAWRLDACQNDRERSEWAESFGRALTGGDRHLADDEVEDLTSENNTLQASNETLNSAIDDAIEALDKIELDAARPKIDAIIKDLELALEMAA